MMSRLTGLEEGNRRLGMHKLKESMDATSQREVIAKAIAIQQALQRYRALELEQVTTQAWLDARRVITDEVQQYVMKGGIAAPSKVDTQQPAE